VKSRGLGDTDALSEILDRRFGHIEWQNPRMIVVDGGVAQVNAAKKILKSLGFEIPVIAVTKNSRHKASSLLGDKTLIRRWESDILLANAEAHRFAINYHRKLRSK